MKLSLLTATTLLAALAMATKAPLKSVVVTFPENTPDSVMNRAKDSIRNSGGKITHEYNIIKGFAAEAPESSLTTMSTLDANYKPHVEEDQVVTIS